MSYTTAFGLLEKPLSKTGLKKIVKDGRISVNIAVDLSDLIGHSVDSLNDLADERILKDGASLSNIFYTVTGCIPGTPSRAGREQLRGAVILNVNADVSIGGSYE